MGFVLNQIHIDKVAKLDAIVVQLLYRFVHLRVIALRDVLLREANTNATSHGIEHICCLQFNVSVHLPHTTTVFDVPQVQVDFISVCANQLGSLSVLTIKTCHIPSPVDHRRE